MFNTILTSIKPNGETVHRLYEGKTEKLSVYFATNLWSKYDKTEGEELLSLKTISGEPLHKYYLGEVSEIVPEIS